MVALWRGLPALFVTVIVAVALVIATAGDRTQHASRTIAGTASSHGRAAGASSAGVADADDPIHAVRLVIGSSPSDRAVPSGFVGFSIEYPSLPAYAGRSPAALNPIFTRLVRDLVPGGSPVIRIGGDTTDGVWWPTKGVARPPGVKYALTRGWLAVARASAVALGARMILGINLEADSARIASTEARAFLNGLGRRLIAAFELGNEPEVYGSIGWYTNSAGVGVPGRRSSYDFHSYLSDYKSISSSLPRSVPLAGPALSGFAWLSRIRKFLVTEPRVALFTVHAYPLRRCYVSRRSAEYPTIAHLLAARAASLAAGRLRPVVALAHARGVQVRVDELNSVSCKGARGVSDTFASALWVLDTLFHMAQAGVDGVNIHTLSGVPYEPFAFTRRHGRWQAEVKPIYYGLLLFTRAAPAGSRLLPTFHSPSAPLRSWATRGPGGTIRVLLMDDSPIYGLTVAVRAPLPVRSVSLERLTAPGLAATSGVTLAGQSFGRTTTTGLLSGALRTATLSPVQDRYVVTLAPASAALLTMRAT